MMAGSTRTTAFADLSQRTAVGVVHSAVCRLVTQSKLINQLAIRLEICAFQIFEVTAAHADHPEQAAPAVVILGVRTEVIGEIVDPFRQYRHLHLRGPSVSRVHAIFVNRGGFYKGHSFRSKFLRVS
jgi:hypothetical protein